MRDQRKFKREVSKARIVSEHAFGMTKGRWRVLLKRLDEDIDRIPDTIIACCVLHSPSEAAAAVLQALVQYIAKQ